MKKWIITLLIALVTLISVYIFSPNDITVDESLTLKCSSSALERFLGDTLNWKKWWPIDTKYSDKSNQSYKGYRLTLSKVMYNAYDILLTNKTDVISSRIIVLPFGRDSLTLRWETVLKQNINPFLHSNTSRQAKEIKQCISGIINSLYSFMSTSRNIYGFDIHLTTLKDTTLIATKNISKIYPSTEQVYRMVNTLRIYIASMGSKETNYPMLNVRKENDSFLTMVAIPTNKELKGNERLFPKRMIIIKDNTLLIEVHGGVLSVQKAFFELGNYMQDHHYGAPALPFESLITDRSKETDTTKWITRIYAPIM